MLMQLYSVIVDGDASSRKHEQTFDFLSAQIKSIYQWLQDFFCSSSRHLGTFRD